MKQSHSGETVAEDVLEGVHYLWFWNKGVWKNETSGRQGKGSKFVDSYKVKLK